LNTVTEFWSSTRAQVRGWSWLKKSYAAVFGIGFVISSFLFLTPPGESIREWMAQTVITTQHRDWAWMVVGKEKRDRMVAQLHLDRERMGAERQDFSMLKIPKRSVDEIIKVEDISSTYWKGKKMYVYDPRSIRVVVPAKAGEGERISSMVERTGAVAGVNGGGFVDPDGLGNGFAPIGFIMSGGELLYTDQDGSIPQHVVGFTKEGALVVGKYTIDQLEDLGVSEAVMFYPRVIANGKALITQGDGGWGRGPRTAIGQKEDGTVIIMVIDGRQTHSVGATLKELQDLMLEEGVVNAGFLDGGASSELVLKDQGLVTKPSSRYGERRLPSALLVFDDPNSYKANNPWDGVTKIDPGGAHDHPEFLKEQERLRSQGKLKPSPSPTPVKSPEGSAKPSTSPSASPKTTPQASGGSLKPGTGGSTAPSTTPAAGGGATASPPASTKPPTGGAEASASPQATTQAPTTSPKPPAVSSTPATGVGTGATSTPATGGSGATSTNKPAASKQP